MRQVVFNHDDDDNSYRVVDGIGMVAVSVTTITITSTITSTIISIITIIIIYNMHTVRSRRFFFVLNDPGSVGDGDNIMVADDILAS